MANDICGKNVDTITEAETASGRQTGKQEKSFYRFYDIIPKEAQQQIIFCGTNE
jgi:hypothetical protein